MKIFHQYLPGIQIQCPTFVEFEQPFPLHEAMYNHKKTQDSPYAPIKCALHSILRPEKDKKSIYGHVFEKTVSFDDIAHFSDEENIKIFEDFDCDITLYPETPTEVAHID